VKNWPRRLFSAEVTGSLSPSEMKTSARSDDHLLGQQIAGGEQHQQHDRAAHPQPRHGEGDEGGEEEREEHSRHLQEGVQSRV
jgi:hypothetical protein